MLHFLIMITSHLNSQPRKHINELTGLNRHSKDDDGTSAWLIIHMISILTFITEQCRVREVIVSEIWVEV